MDTSGIIQSYNSRAASSAALTRALVAPQYAPVSYSGAPSGNLLASHQQLQQPNPFGFGPYTGGHSTPMIPEFAATNYIQRRPVRRMIEVDNGVERGLSHLSNPRQGYAEEHHISSPMIKTESNWKTEHSWDGLPTVTSSFAPSNAPTVTSRTPVNVGAVADFGTEVDTLMKAIQAKSESSTFQPPSTEQNRTVVGAYTPPYSSHSSQSSGSESGLVGTPKLTGGDYQDGTTSTRGKKRYQCTIGNCTKVFQQKTHLDIHERAHTGEKPYACKRPGCGQGFSQLGNLKTHERRHTGEKPFQCDTCGKRFAQRGNVRAHKITHGQAKPYHCQLDACGKSFTQLGNLKCHQNKYHINTIRSLTAKFASIKDGDIVHAGDKELWEYFANLYKNSNKGIKGRGKDRKVGSTSTPATSGLRNLGVDGHIGYSRSGAGRSNMGGLIGMPSNIPSRGSYEMFDINDESMPANHHRSGPSSVGSCYDDAPSDNFGDAGRGGELAFGDRIY
ncbi:uncharacterized protein BP5553_07261 [Venustampulla echinocandica]|uniref:C2H2-type domain-containing protein n=1 Tax=Venustampulla echinocandica TaxID=2656787 RepID=A0A370TJ12_9HELO|nr:uncharacterized protein BP5553_07261 [Venustampulla echinocandica]RDL35330.1 hypothetical protein BP5553_07261 [Venustampulla echinocandica]